MKAKGKRSIADRLGEKVSRVGKGVVRPGLQVEEAVFGPYSCRAGVVSGRDDRLEVAFFGHPAMLRAVKSGTLDGEPVDVVNVRRSGAGGKPGVKGMVVLTVVPRGES